jgi:hypothetical protein
MTLLRMGIANDCDIGTFEEVPDESRGHAIDVDPAIVMRWRQAESAWEDCQDEMYKAATHARDRRTDRTERGARIIPTWPIP